MKYIIPTIALAVALLASCSGGCRPESAVHDERRAVYYWKTVFQFDSTDITFLREHRVGRMYIRMFDVCFDSEAIEYEEKAYPNASIKFSACESPLLCDTTLDIDFVPVVYITVDALRAMREHEGVLASNIVTRVRNMCEYNGVPDVRELQLDCDWTASTENSFFSLCDSVRQTIAALDLPWRLSSTIRLHQLSRPAPPVDRGVLMVYNTGSFSDPDARNSIIDPADVEPYLTHLRAYPLHLDVAYPAYSWQLLFHHRQFVGLVRNMNLTDTAKFALRNKNVYEAIRDFPFNDRIIHKGDVVRQETSPYQSIAYIRDMIEKRLSGRPHSNIIYHFDSGNLSNYSSDEIDCILSVAR